mmetsp:Transcript_15672/g.44768  ORF Transcript_15672/g.44768 Transcript_15672/m.44768 type:complete len:270 (-) Transcript_15672:3494-4303(-)
MYPRRFPDVLVMISLSIKMDRGRRSASCFCESRGLRLSGLGGLAGRCSGPRAGPISPATFLDFLGLFWGDCGPPGAWPRGASGLPSGKLEVACVTVLGANPPDPFLLGGTSLVPVTRTAWTPIGGTILAHTTVVGFPLEVNICLSERRGRSKAARWHRRATSGCLPRFASTRQRSTPRRATGDQPHQLVRTVWTTQSSASVSPATARICCPPPKSSDSFIYGIIGPAPTFPRSGATAGRFGTLMSTAATGPLCHVGETKTCSNGMSSAE